MYYANRRRDYRYWNKLPLGGVSLSAHDCITPFRTFFSRTLFVQRTYDIYHVER